MRSIRYRAVILICMLYLAASGLAGTYTEHFTSTAFIDTLNTTADLDTIAGELRLFPFLPTLVGTYDTPGVAWGVACGSRRPGVYRR